MYGRVDRFLLVQDDPQQHTSLPSPSKQALRHCFCLVHASASSTQCLMNCQRRLSSSSSSTTPPFSKQALRHCFSLVHTGASSTQCVTNNRRRRQQSYPHSSSSPILLFSKKLSDTASTQCAPATPTERLVSNCGRHHQPGLFTFENCFRFEDPSRRQ